MQVLLPGDPLPSTSSASSSATALHLGPGLQSALPVAGAPSPANDKGKAREDVLAIKAGLLGFQDDGKAEKWWVEGQARRVRCSCFPGGARKLDAGLNELAEVF